MIRRNYINEIEEVSVNFGALGFEDGFADMTSDHDQIILQLYGKIDKEELIFYLDMYLQGYDIGCFMSEESEEIYDQDGYLKENVNLETCSQEEYARHLVLNYKKR